MWFLTAPTVSTIRDRLCDQVVSNTSSLIQCDISYVLKFPFSFFFSVLSFKKIDSFLWAIFIYSYRTMLCLPYKVFFSILFKTGTLFYPALITRLPLCSLFLSFLFFIFEIIAVPFSCPVFTSLI